MAFRRVIVTVPEGDNKKFVEDDIKRLFSLANFKNDFKDVKTEIKPSVKDNVLVIDLNGDGADSVSRKVKDLATKHKADVKIRNEKPMSGVKEGRAMPNIIGSVLNKLQDELTPEVANDLWRDKAAEITNIINSVRNMTGTSTGQKVDAAVSKIKNLQQMNENKKPQFNLKSLILETLVKVKEEAKAKKAESEDETEESPEGEEKPKGKKLEKDEIGKFYVVTRPTKADDEIVHETNVLDLITKIKSGAIDATRILGAFKKRGGANGLAKIHLKQISAELDELQNDMKVFREAKKTVDEKKAKAKTTILKYKPAPEVEPENLDEAKKKLKVSAIVKKTKPVTKTVVKKVEGKK